MSIAAEPVESEKLLTSPPGTPPTAQVAPPTELAVEISAAPLLLAWTLPQLLLLAMNWADARFLAQSASGPQLAALHSYAWVWLAVFLAGAGWLGQLAWRRRPATTATLVSLAMTPIALLVFYSAQAATFWPATVAPWMLDQGNVLMRQEMLLLVPCYAAAWELLNFRISPVLRWRLGLAGVCAACALPLLMMSAHVASFGPFVLIAFGLGAAAGGFFLLRKLDLWWRLGAERTDLRVAPMALAFFVPLLGLFLNAGLQFPASFQAPPVYVLLVLNAAALAWPVPAAVEGRRVLWLARCATLPFTAYFFVVFLPILPFWLPGVLMLGGGLLILAPAALANFHFSLIASGWREHCAAKRSAGTAVLALGAVVLIPAGVVGYCQGERANLRAALNAIVYPELRAAALPQVDADQLRRTLQLGAQAEARRGSDVFGSNGVPFLDDLRRRIVLGGLAIPAKLRAQLAEAFLPQDPPAKAPAQRRMQEPDQRASITSREITTTALPGAPGWEQTAIRLHLQATGAREAEWVARIELPPDAFVTDHALVIDGQRVPSRLTDRNTALFVYERITRAEIPRDPGLIIYTGPETIEARVFPVPSEGGRDTDFTITHRAGAAARIVLAGLPLVNAPAAGAGAELSVLVPSAGGSALFPAGGTLSKFAFVRTPERLVLADGTAKGTGSEPASVWHAGRSLTRVQQWPLRDLKDPLWPEATLGRIVLAEHLRSAQDKPELRPLLEWVSTRPFPSGIVGLARTLAADFAEAGDATLRPVVVLRCGGVVRAVAPEAVAVWFDEARSGSGVEIYDPALKRYLPFGVQVQEAAQIRGSVGAMLVSRERELHPERFRENSSRLWKVAREARTLTSQTAFIVVENLAQWAMLEKKEKERENAPDALSSPVSVPEPGTWALLIAGGLGLLGYRLKRKKA